MTIVRRPWRRSEVGSELVFKLGADICMMQLPPRGFNPPLNDPNRAASASLAGDANSICESIISLNADALRTMPVCGACLAWCNFP